MKRWIKRITVIVVVLGAGAAVAVWYFRGQAAGASSYRTAAVSRGDVRVSIQATGTVEPEEVVDVGAQVAGQVVSFGQDANGRPVGYGSAVEEGTVLAQIDDSLYAADVAQDDAQVQAAQAGLAEAQAVLRRAQRNLGYCTIRSPVKGVVIDRRVNIGQTVVSSLNAPSLFLIAKDLRRMQVWVAVNEADIGKIHPGQPVSFTVDAFAGLTLSGQVGKVRLNASMTQNVVTYTVEVQTDNSSGLLLPYLTTNVQFELDRRRDVLRVPNAALRWQPQTNQVAPEFRQASAGTGGPARSGGQSPPSSQPGEAPPEHASRAVVWAVQGPYVRPVPVRVGLTDGTLTEVQGEGLAEGLEVVVGEDTQAPADGGTSSPFTPRFPRGWGGGTSRPQ